MTLLEALFGASVAIGTVVMYLTSRREYPDKLYSAGLLVAVAGGFVLELTGESWALAVAYAGLALAFAVTVASIEWHILGGST